MSFQNPFAKQNSKKTQVQSNPTPKVDSTRENVKKTLINALEKQKDNTIQNLVKTSEQIAIEIEQEIYEQNDNSAKTVYKLKRTLSDFQINEINLNDISDYNNDKTKKIKKKKDIEENCEHENELIKGYQPPLIVDNFEEKKKMKQPEYISPATVLKKEFEMFIKVNPIEYEKQERQRLLDDKFLKKKMLNKKIYEEKTKSKLIEEQLKIRMHHGRKKINDLIRFNRELQQDNIKKRKD